MIVFSNSKFKMQNDKQARVVSNYSRLLFLRVMGNLGVMGIMGERAKIREFKEFKEFREMKRIEEKFLKTN